jgi:PTH1 family peptidyl-tRNA hydrolase
MFQLVVALGNPGPDYAKTRHNVGWLFLESLNELSKVVWKNKFKGEYAELSLQGEKVYFLKPLTFMNLSGESVQAMCGFFKILPESILVIHDELDLPFGQIHFKKGGGLAGHNGLKSMANCLGTDQFSRMRIGIGRPTHGTVANWVLNPFSKEESMVIDDLFKKMHDPWLKAMIEGIAKAGIYNKKNLLT